MRDAGERREKSLLNLENQRKRPQNTLNWSRSVSHTTFHVRLQHRIHPPTRVLGTYGKTLPTPFRLCRDRVMGMLNSERVENKRIVLH